jgi:hypothetical protein
VKCSPYHDIPFPLIPARLRNCQSRIASRRGGKQLARTQIFTPVPTNRFKSLNPSTVVAVSTPYGQQPYRTQIPDWCACAGCRSDLPDWPMAMLAVCQGKVLYPQLPLRGGCSHAPFRHLTILVLGCRMHVAGASSYLRTFHVDY